MAEAFTLHSETVVGDWIDYNGHMNVAYYVLIFDHATDDLLETVGINAAYREAHNKSLFVAESHIVYKQEVLEGTQIEIETQILNADDKRLHLFQTMRESTSKQSAATIETLLVHVDLNIRKAAPFPDFLKSKLASHVKPQSTHPLPTHIGRQIKF